MSNALPPHGQQHSRFASELPFCSSSSPLSPWCHLTISSSVVPFLLPSIFPSIRVFFNESALHIRWPKYWRFSISPSNEYSGLISFQIDWFDLLAVKVTFKSFLQRLSLKASILLCSLWSNYHIHTWLLEKPQLWLDGPLSAKWCTHINSSKRETSMHRRSL